MACVRSIKAAGSTTKQCRGSVGSEAQHAHCRVPPAMPVRDRCRFQRWPEQVYTAAGDGLDFRLLYRVALPGGSVLPDAADVILPIPHSSTGAESQTGPATSSVRRVCHLRCVPKSCSVCYCSTCARFGKSQQLAATEGLCCRARLVAGHSAAGSFRCLEHGLQRRHTPRILQLWCCIVLLGSSTLWRHGGWSPKVRHVGIAEGC